MSLLAKKRDPGSSVKFFDNEGRRAEKRSALGGLGPFRRTLRVNFHFDQHLHTADNGSASSALHATTDQRRGALPRLHLG